MQQKYGNLVRLDIPGSVPLVLVFNPEDVEKVYKNDGKYPFQPGFEAIGWYRRTRKDLYKGNGTLFD